MQKEIETSCQKRLGRIEGQMCGLSKMVEDERYCIDIVAQISAVRAALRRVEEEVLKDHVSHCVETCHRKRRQIAPRKKIAELMAVKGRAERFLQNSTLAVRRFTGKIACGSVKTRRA